VDPGAAVDRRPGVAKGQPQPRADPRHGLASGHGLGGVRLGGLDPRPVEVAAEAGVVLEARAVHRETLLDGRSRTALGAALTVRLVGEVLAEGRQVRRARRLLDRGAACCPLAHPRQATPEEGAGGPHRSRLAVGVGEPAAAAPDGQPLGGHCVLVGRATRDGLHRQRRPAPTRPPVASPQGSQPGPR
jgi:hypothetical protein